MSFRLYTRKNMADNMFKVLRSEDVLSFRNSYFDHCKPTKIAVHGYRSRGHAPWMMSTKDELLKAGDYNVILVDWEKGAEVDYSKSTSNTPLVAAKIVKLIAVLKEQVGADPADFHIIGHSLGAHIGGYVGEKVPNLGRITGLDPAALNFQYKDKTVRLDPTDAQFVDVIHTDGRNILLFGLGMFDPMGHVDYYPNGGLVQPGCKAISIFGAVCRHRRSFEFFIESINSACPFKSYRCQSYDHFKQGLCIPCSDERCGYMGYHADRTKAPADGTNFTYFLNTGDSTPFCRYHYQITISLENKPELGNEKGTLMVKLMGSNGELGETALTSGAINIEPGKTYGFIVTSMNDLSTVNTVTIKWLQEKETSGKIYIEKVKIVSGEAGEM
ncbi:hypothetical protein ACJMK2_040838 [Sinanodonta woodiana]|uniref:PLAT domain-containing protein n=1 Tax=Sinanodonta woodiana TaxID=1069815 RepID=A0ABD3W531_SINWO